MKAIEFTPPNKSVDSPQLPATNISDFFSGKELTKGQYDLVNELEQFLIGDDCSVFLLKGYAGVGKTFLTIGITNYLNSGVGRQFVLMAPTGKAAKVIANKTKKEAQTIHRGIYSYFENNKNETDNEFDDEPPVTNSKIKDNKDSADTIYIIDEASMVSNQYSSLETCKFGTGYLLDDLIKYINVEKGNKKVIFIGDNAQLPPVRDDFSPALDVDYLQNRFQLSCMTFELTEVVRQKALSGVVVNATRLRNAIIENDFEDLTFDISADDVSALSYQDTIDECIRLCDNKVEKASGAIIIAYSNAQVRDYNNAIRARLFSFEARLQVNENIICVSNYNRDDKFVSNGEFGRVVKVLSNPEIRTVEVSDGNKKGSRLKLVDLCFIDVEIEFINDQGQSYTIITKVLSNLLYSSIPRLSPLEYRALHKDFLQRNPQLNKRKNPAEFKEKRLSDPYLNVMQIKFGYAITCHKSQGSEWAHVFVDSYMKNPKSKAYFRWLYTAITRTSGNLYINKNLNFGLKLP